ncbi:hypothetical protein, partial [Sphingobacterium sp.]|uniref:hypothetical protein n=1 Tax=Sphingobacterium sp. TaxID=341027 RepID=UPI0028A8B72B
YTAYRTSQDAFFKRETIRRGFENPAPAMAFTIGAAKVLRLGKDETPAVNDLLLCRPCTRPAWAQVYHIPVCRYGIAIIEKDWHSTAFPPARQNL